MSPQALLETAAELLGRVLAFEHPADAVVSRFFREHRNLGPRERGTLTETVYAVLRKKLLFDKLALSGRGPVARRLAILGWHAAQPGSRDFLASALNEQERAWLAACDAVRPEELLDLHRHNLPEWLAAALKEQLGAGQANEEFWALVESLNTSAGLDLRVNTLVARREDVQKELMAAGIAAEATPYSPWGLRVQGKPALNKVDAYVRGAIEVQDEGSQLLALLLGAGRGEMVVDFCAGAGGKTLAIGAAMRNTGRLYAFDTSAHRLDALKPRLARSGLSNVHPAAIAHERDERIKRLAGKIDRVLVDAPCSGLGTLRRNPDLKWRQNAQSVQEAAAKQKAILEGASRLLKPGGRLVYATCSLLRAENEEVADAFSAAHSDFEPLSAEDVLTQLKLASAADLCTGDKTGDAESVTGRLYLRLWPHRHQCDGFFAAIWQKR